MIMPLCLQPFWKRILIRRFGKKYFEPGTCDRIKNYLFRGFVYYEHD